MAITANQIKELISITMKDCPLPSVADIMCAAGPDDVDIMFNFIKDHYTEEQIKIGCAEFRSRVEFVNRMFGAKDGT